MKSIKFVSTLFVVSTSLLACANMAYAGEMQAIAASAPYNWSGLYVGLNAGAVKHTMNITDNQAATFFATIQQDADPQITGGFQLGYRHQLAMSQASGVFGLELSANFSNADFNQEFGSPFALYQLRSENELKNLCLLQFMGGIAADRTLLFLTAGLSWTNISGTVTNVDGVPFFDSFNVSDRSLNTVVGGGIEYAFSNKVSARIKVDVILSSPYSTVDNAGNRYQISNDIVQGTFGINYKFG